MDAPGADRAEDPGDAAPAVAAPIPAAADGLGADLGDDLGDDIVTPAGPVTLGARFGRPSLDGLVFMLLLFVASLAVIGCPLIGGADRALVPFVLT